MERFYAPFLANPYVKAVVILLFAFLLVVGINYAPSVELGLAQQVCEHPC